MYLENVITPGTQGPDHTRYCISYLCLPLPSDGKI
jgi:hypothetical protein